MTVLITAFIAIGLFLAVLGYGIWSDFKRQNEFERIKAEREARKYGNTNMTPVA